MPGIGRIIRKIPGAKDRRGATAIVVAIVLIVLLGIAALAVDIGYLYAVKNELQNAADGAALAAARQLGNIYSNMTYDQILNYTCGTDDQNLIRTTAVDLAAKNKAAAKFITIDPADVEIGTWDQGASPPFVATYNKPDAVRVTARRENTSADGTVSTFFARVLGIDEASVVADATAALTSESTSEPGELELPIGISKFRFTSEYCNKPIKFSPTGDPDACAGWHVFDESSSSANTLNTIIQGMIDGTYESPGTVAGTTEFNFTGGEISNAFDTLRALLEARAPDTLGHMYFKDGNIGAFDLAGNWYFYDATTPGAELVTDNKDVPIERREWITGVVVYDWDDCSNPNTDIKIVGYATVKLWCVLDTQVRPTDAALLVVGEILCEGYNDGRGGGGGDYGTKGTIPGLVE